MTRRPTHSQDPDPQDLNLAPIMNMVVILIPLLLLSVVFLSVSVIDVNAPRLCCGILTDHSSDTDPRPPLNLNVHVNHQGLVVTAQGKVIDPLPGCQDSGVTLCLLQGERDMQVEFEAARDQFALNHRDEGQKRLEDATDAYDWRRLYNLLTQLKASYPEERIVMMTAEDSIPHAVIVRMMDVTRTKLERGHYDDDVAFWQANVPRQSPPLFDMPTLKVY